MPTLDWRKWSDAWSAAFPKNPMWRSVRSGDNDPETGEPIYRFPDAHDGKSMDPGLADVVAAHRFIAPAVAENGVDEHCFCGWVGPHHGDHLQEKVDEYHRPVSPAKKAAPKKAAPKAE